MVDHPVRVIVDSTLDVPPSVATDLGITVVPLQVHFGAESFLDGIDLTADEFVQRLRASDALPTTSQPVPARFEEAFRSALDAGEDVVCLTLSRDLSGTHDNAAVAARTVDPDRIRVIDTRSVSIGGGFVAMAAARLARSGAGLETVAAHASEMTGRTHLYAALDTLENLHKGGRIGRASMLVGSILSIKPIIAIRDGHVVPVERVRTWRKALTRMAELAEGHGPADALGVMHVGNPDDATTVAARIASLEPDGRPMVGQLGPVVATYGGPGLIGIVIVTRA
ncbi:MAG TPA: DegV family protein [Thermomicrobiales bacterium]|jgi:DegV family protein with EDD domain|nr:DegV family protein [Thermomicrobiales bacterium]